MSYLLDTNVVIALLKRDRKTTFELRSRLHSDIYVSSLVMHELYFGAFKSNISIRSMEEIESLALPVLPFEKIDARMSGNLRYLLERQGTPIGPIDTLIAGQALARDLTLISRNVREFSRIDGLCVENWEA